MLEHLVLPHHDLAPLLERVARRAVSSQKVHGDFAYDVEVLRGVGVAHARAVLAGLDVEDPVELRELFESFVDEMTARTIREMSQDAKKAKAGDSRG